MRNKRLAGDMSIICIMSHTPPYDIYSNEPRPELNWNMPNGKWVGIWGYEWPDLLGNELLKISDEINYEVWQPDLRADRIYSHKFKNGLVHKLFPSRRKYYFDGLKIRKGIYSKAIISELYKEIEEKKNVILHLNAKYSCFTKSISFEFYGRIPIIHQFYSDYINVFCNERTSNFIKMIHRKMKNVIYSNYFSNVKEILISKNEGIEVLKQRVNAKIHTVKWGIDFNEWTIDKSKKEARKLLNIPENKYLMLSSSRLYSLKQIDKLITVLSEVSHRDFLCYISGHGDNEYEEKLKKLVENLGMINNIIFVGYVDKDTLKNYYLSSDLFISSSASEMGPYSSMLALALEIPIMTTDTGLVSEILKGKNIGIILPISDYNTWREEIEKAIKGKEINILERKSVISLFNWNRIANEYRNIYMKVINSFYGEI